MNVVELGEVLAVVGGRLVGPYVTRESEPVAWSTRPASGPIVDRAYAVVLADERALRGATLQATEALRELGRAPLALLSVDQAGDVQAWTPLSPLAVVAEVLRDRLGPAKVEEGRDR